MDQNIIHLSLDFYGNIVIYKMRTTQKMSLLMKTLCNREAIDVNDVLFTLADGTLVDGNKTIEEYGLVEYDVITAVVPGAISSSQFKKKQPLERGQIAKQVSYATRKISDQRIDPANHIYLYATALGETVLYKLRRTQILLKMMTVVCNRYAIPLESMIFLLPNDETMNPAKSCDDYDLQNNDIIRVVSIREKR